MFNRLINLAIIITVTYFVIWTRLCRLGCRPGRYGNTDDTLGVIRLPSCGTIGGPNSSRNFGPGSGASGSNIGVVKASSSNRNGRSVSFTSISGTKTIPLKTEKALHPGANSSEISVVKCCSSSRIGPSDTGSGYIDIPSGGTSSGPNGGPRKNTVSTPGSGPGGTNGSISVPHQYGYVVPLSNRGNRERRCTCEACPCALIEKLVVPVAQVGMNSVDIASERFNDVTDWLLRRLGVFVAQSRHAGPRQAQILHSRTTTYNESVEDLRLVENLGFKQTVSTNPSANISLVPSLHNSTQYIRELVKKISETVTGQKTSEPSVKVPKVGSNRSIKVSEKVAGRSDQKTKKVPKIPPLKTKATSKITAKQIKKTFDQGVKISEKGPDLSTKKTKGAPGVSNQKPEKGSDMSTVATSEIIVKKTGETFDLTSQKSDKISNLSIKETETVSNPPKKSSEIACAATSSAEEHKMLMPPHQSSKLSNASDDSKIIRPSEDEETYEPGRYCSECARQGKVCMGGCPTADKLRKRREQSKK